MADTAATGITRARTFLSEVGPTWIASAIAAGPATMATLVAAGASFEYALLWVVVLSAVLGALSQYLATRLGLLTEAGIVSVVEEHLGGRWAWLLVVDVVLAAGLAQIVITKTLADVSAALSGIDPRAWGIVWGVVLAVGLAGGGYRVLEVGAKVLVAAIVVVFVASLFFVPVDYGAAAGGLVPSIPGVGGAVLAAGVLGGAVHVTLVTMQSYTIRARGWTSREYGLATVDVAGSMLVAFGLYSVAIFVVAASVLAPDQAGDALTAAEALGPAVGEYAQLLFLLGLWGAAISTLGANTSVPPYLLADRMGWDRDVSDTRFRAAVVVVALAGSLGAFLEGAFFPLLTLTLAFGLVGTPFALAIVLYLLNDPQAVPERNSAVANVGGLVLIGIAGVVGAEFVLEEWAALVDAGVTGAPTSAAVVVFALALGLATLALGAQFLRQVANVPGGAAPER